MTHHNSTPERILQAPTRTYEVIATQNGLSRAERRSKRAVSIKRRIGAAMAGPNVPYRKSRESA